ncbi:phospholipase effector Tle1 domain-containing protein [Rhodococcus pyridinivorans]|uniref:phospholipase effector Tle1 domain-containing protein n=1 Tax=Rhodococcus pyridinivorans TaxID=103816 RepID=UPI0021FE5A86|nr:DUF2235 domain-containing protein [Rhodococcus pyridinivorans]
MSIDEYRRPYKVDEVANDRIDEVWFTGVHSDVGGGFEDCRNRRARRRRRPG